MGLAYPAVMIRSHLGSWSVQASVRYALECWQGLLFFKLLQVVADDLARLQ